LRFDQKVLLSFLDWSLLAPMRLMEERRALLVIEVMNLGRNQQQNHHSTAPVPDLHSDRARLQMEHSPLASEENRISVRPVLRPAEMIQIQRPGMMPMACRSELEQAIQSPLLETARFSRSSSAAQREQLETIPPAPVLAPQEIHRTVRA
jgi:hypothetical protein